MLFSSGIGLKMCESKCTDKFYVKLCYFGTFSHLKERVLSKLNLFYKNLEINENYLKLVL